MGADGNGEEEEEDAQRKSYAMQAEEARKRHLTQMEREGVVREQVAEFGLDLPTKAVSGRLVGRGGGGRGVEARLQAAISRGLARGAPVTLWTPPGVGGGACVGQYEYTVRPVVC